MKKVFAILSLLLMCHFAHSQDNKIIVRFVDSETSGALQHVRVLTASGTVLGISDRDGYAVLPFNAIATNGWLLARHDGYKIDTLRTVKEQYYLSRLSVDLETAVISSATVKRLLNLPSEYVVDYTFNGDEIVVATFSGGNGRKAKVLLLDAQGKELNRCAVPDEPMGVYRSCVGMYYCICDKQFYPLNFNNGSVSLKKPYPINLLRGLQQCEQSINGNLYYHITDKQSFRVAYGMIARGDSIFKPIVTFEEPEEARASFIELMEIIDLLEHYQFKEAGRKAGLRGMWDKGALLHINMPLYAVHDTLIVFDYSKKQVLFFDTSGTALGNVPANFEWNHAQLFNILKDAKTDKLYIHRYANKAKQTLEEITPSGNIVGMRVNIAKPFAENLKVNNGQIYYLWQDGNNAATRQLFVQQMK